MIFTGNLSIAEEVTYDVEPDDFPSSQHPALEINTVQQALDQLRENTGLTCASGDGQEVKPGDELPQPLEVRVANDQWPRRWATVRFEVAADNGTLTSMDGLDHGPVIDVITDNDGFARCRWTPDPAGSTSQRAKASLIDPLVGVTTGSPGLVYFNANLSIAEQVDYVPNAESSAGVATAQAALDDLYSIKVNRAGDTIDGSLTLTGDLTTSGSIQWALVNTDSASISFESTGDGPNLSNLVFETFDNSDEGFIFRTTGIERARIDDRGLIVTSNTDTESLTARVKEFLIDHPSPIPPVGITQLAHASLDGVDYAVYYRGEATLGATNGQAIIALPDYFEDLTDSAGRTVLLSAQGDTPFALSASAITAGQFTAHGQPGGAFTWEVKAVRRDVSPLDVLR